MENEEHCDFVKLREAILRTNQDSLRERTHSVLYERYRRDRLRQMKMCDGDAGPKMMEAFVQVQFYLIYRIFINRNLVFLATKGIA